MADLAALSDSLIQAWRNLPLGPTERSFIRALAIGAVLFAVIYAIERGYRAPSEQYRTRPFLHDVAYWFYYRAGVHYFLFLALVFGVLAEPLAAANLRLLDQVPFALQAVLYMVAVDFFVYWIHRAQHHFRFLWAFHSTHHSQEHLSFATSQRVHPVDHLVQDVLMYVPLRILGFDEASWIPLYILGEFSLAAQHSRIPWRYGALYPVVVSPVFHSYHHAVDPAHHNRNFAGLFSFWDYVFGTAVRACSAAPTRFGLASVPAKTLLQTLTAPCRMLREFYGAKPAGRDDRSNVRH